jgi:hypothetical protein
METAFVGARKCNNGQDMLALLLAVNEINWVLHETTVSQNCVFVCVSLFSVVCCI